MLTIVVEREDDLLDCRWTTSLVRIARHLVRVA